MPVHSLTTQVAGDEGTKVSSSVHHEVAFITLNNPPVNAFHPSLARDLEIAVKQAYGNPLVKVNTH
jgi:enoyl-CoA hydratase/carnithine racemase